MSTFRRRVAATVLAASAAVALSACGTSFSAQTNQQYQAAEGANSRGEVAVMNTVLVADEDGKGVLSAGVVNRTDEAQTITGITITKADGSKLTVEGPRGIEIKPGQILTLGKSGGEATFVVTDGAQAGQYVTIALTFSSAETNEVDAPTVARSATYESVAEAK